MQYLLDSEEYNQLRNLPREFSARSEIKLQTLASRLARLGDRKGCIKDGGHDQYCDDCPALDLCPNRNKSFSK